MIMIMITITIMIMIMIMIVIKTYLYRMVASALGKKLLSVQVLCKNKKINK